MSLRAAEGKRPDENRVSGVGVAKGVEVRAADAERGGELSLTVKWERKGWGLCVCGGVGVEVLAVKVMEMSQTPR